ncbi:MAG TPA: glutathione peroxidase [Tepidisphaeraceae bacterium]|nr:glutathione peroxidase [Tepidisphaeraceae bacterium]
MVGWIGAGALLRADDKPTTSVFGFTMKSLAGEDVNLAQYQGKVVMVVNTASKCGFTPQYKDLEALYEKYKDKGFVILGFPANNFGKQEPGTDAQIAEFCKDNYSVSFPMFSKISVLEPDKAAIYKYLTTQPQEKTKESGEVKWNFEKFLIGKDGKLVSRWRSPITPMSNDVVQTIETELAK